MSDHQGDDAQTTTDLFTPTKETRTDLEDESGATSSESIEPASTRSDSSDQPGQWTKDAQGNFVNWLNPPHYVGGVLDLVLPGEERGRMPRAVFRKRSEEYMKLRKREMKKGPQAGET